MKKEQEVEQITAGILIAILVVVVGSLFSCSDKKNKTNIFEDSSKQFAWNESGKETIRSKLKDGNSAEFKDVFFHAYRNENGELMPVTCGKVNSKNSFGGYGGFQRFIAAGSVLSFMEEEVEDMDKVWAEFCYK